MPPELSIAAIMVILEENTEAYGMGGDDQFELKSLSGIETVKIDGGAGSDTIDTMNAHREGLNYISGGGPERDIPSEADLLRTSSL